jgi:hypothetical protein
MPDAHVNVWMLLAFALLWIAGVMSVLWALHRWQRAIHLREQGMPPASGFPVKLKDDRDHNSSEGR